MVPARSRNICLRIAHPAKVYYRGRILLTQNRHAADIFITSLDSGEWSTVLRGPSAHQTWFQCPPRPSADVLNSLTQFGSWNC